MKDLHFSHFNFTIIFKKKTTLEPVDVGTIFRGALGLTLRRMVCTYPEKKYCIDCHVRQTCAYGVLAETSPSVSVLSKNTNIPRPFILHPPILTSPEIAAGQSFTFSIVIVGAAIPLWPYIFQSIRALGEEGIGPYRTGFSLQAVSLSNPVSNNGESVEIYDFKSNLIKNNELIISSDDLQKRFIYDIRKKISLYFVSPTVIKRDCEIVRRPVFSDIIKRLRDRANILSTFFGAGPIIENPLEMAEKAKEIKCDNSGIYWFDNSRFSTKSGTRHKTGGFMGMLNLEGNLEPFWKLLLLGQYINVGKQVSFGNGRYKIFESLI